MPSLAPNRTAHVGCSLKYRGPRPVGIGRALLLGAAWLAMVAGGGRLYAQEVEAPAADVEQEDGEAQQGRPARLLRLRLPITGNADSAFRSIVERTKAQLLAEAEPGVRPLIVIELLPLGGGDTPGQGSDFERALSLARYLTSDALSGVKTIAYVPQTVKGHAVLVALACEEIAMAPTAELGEAGIDEAQDRPIDPTVIQGYRQIASARRTAPEAIAVGMLDPDTEILQVETERSIEFVQREGLEEIEANQTVIRTTTLFPAGTMGLMTAREGRAYGVVKYLTSDRAALARALRIDSQALVEDAAMVADWQPIMYTIDESIDRGVVHRAERYVSNAIAQHQANWIGLRLTSSGGSAAYGLALANYMAELGVGERRTVAYVPTEARGIAAVVALSCDQLIIHEGTVLGGPLADSDALGPRDLESLRLSIQENLGPNTPRTWSLLLAMVDPELEVFKYTNRDSGEERLFSPGEAESQPDANRWRQGEIVKRQGELLELDANLAESLGIASHVVGNVEQLKQLYGFEHDPVEVQPTWSGEIAEALSTPGMAVLLLVIAFAGVYFELHTPGFGLGGFVAAVAVLLFFWSKGLGGDESWLVVVLFVAGVISILIEIFVLPGIGVFGLGGALLVVGSLVLAGQRNIIPQSAADVEELRRSLMVVATAGIAMIVLSLTMRRYLPHIPVFNKLMLAPVEGEELAELNYRESLAEYSHLVGHRGTATTALRPTGRADFDGELVDVIAQSGAIDSGAHVEVVSARASRVVVREVSGS